jgi:hypothetical protein
MLKALSSDYIAGFVDGEGCFALKYRADRKYDKKGKQVHEYYYWGAEFAIVLHPSDSALLDLIKDSFSVGNISFKKTGDQVRYSVQDTGDLKNVIVPFFEKNPLFGMKSKDFDLWKEAVALIFAHHQKPRTGRTHPMSKDTENKLFALKEKIDLHKSRK